MINNVFIVLTVTGPALLSILLGCSVFLVSLGAVTCFCYRRREQSKQRGRGRPLAFTRRPAAVRSPATNTHYLKKSPSPNSRPPSTSPLVRLNFLLLIVLIITINYIFLTHVIYFYGLLLKFGLLTSYLLLTVSRDS